MNPTIVVETDPPVFYCPYDLAIQTMNAMVQAQRSNIQELQQQGLSQEDVDFLMQ